MDYTSLDYVGQTAEMALTEVGVSIYVRTGPFGAIGRLDHHMLSGETAPHRFELHRDAGEGC